MSAAYNELTRTRAELEMLRRAETAREAADQEARERKRRKKDRIESKPRNYSDPANVELLRKQREEQEEKGKRKGKRNGMGSGKGKGRPVGRRVRLRLGQLGRRWSLFKALRVLCSSLRWSLGVVGGRSR